MNLSKLDFSFIEAQWSSHLDAPDGLRFREFLQQSTQDNYRLLFESSEDFLIIEFQKQNPSVYSFAKIRNDPSRKLGVAPDYLSARINTLFFDFDHDDLKVVWKETKRLHKELITRGAIPRVYYTGNRGFHLYLDFPEVKLKYPRETLKRFVEQLTKRKRLKSLDQSTIGDIARCSRLPYTIHEKTGRYCIPLCAEDFKLKIEKLLEFSEGLNLRYIPVVKKLCSLITPVLKRFERQIQKEREAAQQPIILEYPSHEDDRILRYLMKLAPQIKDGQHRILWALIIPRVIHQSDKEIHKIAQQFIEYTGERYAEYRAYVNQTIKRTRKDRWCPWKLTTFLQRYPELYPYFMRKPDTIKQVH